MAEIEKTCENCEYETEDLEGTHCRHCIHNAEEHFAPKGKSEREKAIDEVMEVIKATYHNFCGFDLEQMTKYGNEDASQQNQSYSTMMMYEIAGEFDDLIDALEQLKEGGKDD